MTCLNLTVGKRAEIKNNQTNRKTSKRNKNNNNNNDDDKNDNRTDKKCNKHFAIQVPSCSLPCKSVYTK